MDDTAKYPKLNLHGVDTLLPLPLGMADALQRALRRERRIRFVEDNKEQIKQLHQQSAGFVVKAGEEFGSFDY